MKFTDLYFGEDSRKIILEAVRKMSEAVSTTLGPKGANVLISSKYFAPAVIHDGVTVASSIFLEDPAEREVARLVQQAAQQSNMDTGDGTTTTTLLIYELVKNGMKLIASGMNPMFLKRGMQLALNDVVKQINLSSRPVKEKEWESVAVISAQDEEIGAKVAEVFKLVGVDGSVQVEKGTSEKIEIEHKDGLSYEAGWASPYFMNTDNKSCFLKDARVLITDKPLESSADINTINNIKKIEERPLVIIADGYTDHFLATMVKAKMAGIQIVCLMPPEFAFRRKAMLEDIAISSGAKFITSEVGMNFTDATVADLGTLKTLSANKHSTTMTFDQDSTGEAIKDRIEELKAEQKNEQNDFNKEFIGRRISKLKNGVGVIFAGGTTDVEANEIKERVKDAVGATRSAIQEGVVIGGGTALYHISKILRDNFRGDSREEQAGYELVLKAIVKPMEKLISNSGRRPGRIMEQIDQNNRNSDQFLKFGFNINTDRVEDLEVAKIFDPAKVVRVALENAVSVASHLITSSCLVIGRDDEQ